VSGRPVHEILWRTAGDEPLPALLLTHAAFEAFINHLGERVAPEVWADERAYFTRTPYRGVLGKVNWLCDRLGVDQDWGLEPWQSLRALDSWRNRVAHGKLEEPDTLGKAEASRLVTTFQESAKRVARALHAAGDEDTAVPFD
jgi:hypothetical protein